MAAEAWRLVEAQEADDGPIHPQALVFLRSVAQPFDALLPSLDRLPQQAAVILSDRLASIYRGNYQIRDPNYARVADERVLMARRFVRGEPLEDIAVDYPPPYTSSTIEHHISVIPSWLHKFNKRGLVSLESIIKAALPEAVTEPEDMVESVPQIDEAQASPAPQPIGRVAVMAAPAVAESAAPEDEPAPTPYKMKSTGILNTMLGESADRRDLSKIDTVLSDLSQAVEIPADASRKIWRKIYPKTITVELEPWESELLAGVFLRREKTIAVSLELFRTGRIEPPAQGVNLPQYLAQATDGVLAGILERLAHEPAA